MNLKALKTIIVWLAIGIALFATPVLAQRVTTPLMNGWKFQQNSAMIGPEQPGYNDSSWSTVSVPHTWNRVGYYTNQTIPHQNTAANQNLYQGNAWYRISFSPPPMTNKRVFLQFDAASRIAEVWLNGVRLGQHKGGFSRFRFDATPAMKANAVNTLAVRVNNAAPAAGNETANILPLTIGVDFFVYGGLYRSVSLVTTPTVHFDMLDYGGSGMYATAANVSANSATLTVVSKFKNDSNASVTGASVNYKLVDASGNTKASWNTPVNVPIGSNVQVSSTVTVTSPHLWNGVSDPYLYQIVGQLYTPQAGVLDQMNQSFGFRNIVIDPAHGLYLNGKHIPLHGVSRHQDRETKGWAVSASDEDQDVSIIKEMGANTIRLAHYEQSEHMNELSDKNGLIIWDEIPLVGALTLTPGQTTPPSAELVANAQQQLKELIIQNYNHPAVAVWSISNEIDLLGPPPDPIPMLTDLNNLAHATDPSRPTTLASCCEGRKNYSGVYPPNISAITDTFGANRYPGWYYGAAGDMGSILDTLHGNHLNQPMSVSEYGAGAGISIHTDNPLGGPWNASGYAQPEGYQSYLHETIWPQLNARDYLWSTWVWNMFDFATTIRTEADSVNINTKGLVTYDRTARKDAFYYYKANWTTSPVVHIAEHDYTNRDYQVTDVKVYSNVPSVELLLNGVSLGSKSSCANAVCIWKDVKLSAGNNTLIASSSSATDTVIWQLDSIRTSQIWIASGSIIPQTTSKGLYGSDNYFTGGTGSGTYRYGSNFSYNIPANNGTYNVTLTFLEPDANAASSRVFNVTANGQIVLSNFNIAIAAGGTNKLVTQTFPVTISNGNLNLVFTSVTGDAIVSYVEVTSTSTLTNPLATTPTLLMVGGGAAAAALAGAAALLGRKKKINS